MFWEPFERLGYAFGARFNDEGSVTAIVKFLWAKVPCGGAMGAPAFLFALCIVGNDIRSERDEGSSIEIECIVELCVGSETWVDSLCS